jgi:hypothetical protein
MGAYCTSGQLHRLLRSACRRFAWSPRWRAGPGSLPGVAVLSSGRGSVTTYTLEWNRAGAVHEVQMCNGLTDRDIVRRLIGAIETNGPVTIHAVKRERSAQETPADLVGALQDKVHTDAGPFRAGQSVKETEVCPHGIRAPHECKECADSLVIPDGWCPICGGKDGEHKSGCEDGSEHF